MLSKLTANIAARNFFREFFLSISADPIEDNRLRTAAFLRLVLIVPTIFLVTFISLLDVRGQGHHPQAQEAAFLIWNFLVLLYIAGNIILYRTPEAGIRIQKRLTFLSIFIELATNQLILYLTGSLISPQTLFIIVIIAIYRVFLNYRFALFAAATGCALFAATTFLELSEIIPLHPALPFMVEHPVYAEAFAAVNIVTGILTGIIVAFFSINYGMNQVLKLQKQLKDQSLQDGLTGIANRRRFDDYMDLEWKRAWRNKKPLALILLDIDAFKLYNDNYGHTAGDECLKKVARVLQDGLKRATDLAARYGGEEFAVILPETDAEGAIVLAEELRKKIEGLNIPHQYSPVENHVTASVGICAMAPDKESPSNTIVAEADKALYRAKKNGRNQVVRAVS